MPKEPAAPPGLPPPKLRGKTFVFAHKPVFHPDALLPGFIETAGGTVATEVTAAVDFVVVAEPSPRGQWAAVKKAERLNERGAAIRVVDANDVWAMLTPTRDEALALLRGGDEGIRRWNALRTSKSPSYEYRWIKMPSLAGVDFRKANLRGAVLWDVPLDGADFRAADLTGGSVGGAKDLKLDGARLGGGGIAELTTSSLRDADLTGAGVGNLKGVDLRGATLRGARLWGTFAAGCDFRKADLRGATLDGVTIRGCDFRGADLTGATFKVDFYRGCKVVDTTLAGARLDRAVLARCDLRGIVLTRASLAGADLAGAKLGGADLRGADLSGANCAGADFRGAQLKGADFTGANLIKAHLDPAAEREARGLDKACRKAGKAGPHVRALAAAADRAKRLSTRLVLERPDGRALLKAAFIKGRAGGPCSLSWRHFRADGGHWDFDEAPSLAAGMLRLAGRWAGGTPRLEFLTVECDRPPKGVDLWALAAQAWHEVFGLAVPIPEDLAADREQHEDRRRRLRDELLDELRGGPDGVVRWNERSRTDELKLVGPFDGADLAGARLDGAEFFEVALAGAVFDRAILRKSRLSRSDLRAARFRRADLAEANWDDSRLQAADFTGACLRGARLRSCDLQDARLEKADLRGAHLGHVNLQGADLSTADLAGLTVEGCRFDERTRFPATYTTRLGWVWVGQGPPPAPPLAAGSLDFAAFFERLRGYVDGPRLARARAMLRADRFRLYAQADADHLVGVVKSQTDPDLVYACRLAADGTYGCCTQNLNPCGGLRDGLCKHLLVLIVGLAKAGELDPARVDGWVQLSAARGAGLDREALSDVFLRYRGAEAGEVDWRPTETVPEDYYAL